MAHSAVPQNALDQIAKTTTVLESARLTISTIKDQMQAAHDAALENGATAEELAPVQEAVTNLAAKTDEVTAAIVANTPAA